MNAKSDRSPEDERHGGGPSEGRIRICPTCGAKMSEGRMSGGLSSGRRAWACANYPECTTVEIERTPEEQAILDELMRLEAEAKDAKGGIWADEGTQSDEGT